MITTNSAVAIGSVVEVHMPPRTSARDILWIHADSASGIASQQLALAERGYVPVSERVECPPVPLGGGTYRFGGYQMGFVKPQPTLWQKFIRWFE